MSKLNLFSNDTKESYIGRKNPLDHYHKQCAIYLSRMRNIPYEEALEFIVSNIGKGKAVEPKPPEMVYAYSERLGCKTLGTTTVWDYAIDVLEKDYIMTPAMTSFVPPHIKEALPVKFIFKRSAERDVLKKEKFLAKMKGDKKGADAADAGQNKVKYDLNAGTGTLTIKTTSLYNQTGHPSLTSTCRTGVSYANANNERFIEGIRHYYSVDITIANILATIAEYPCELVFETVNKYQLHVPTVKETFECVLRSAKRNWRSITGEKTVYDLISTMTSAERCTLVYTCDLFHLHKHNPEFMEAFIMKGTEKHDGSHLSDEEAYNIVKTVDGDTAICAHYINQDRTRGTGLGQLGDPKDKLYNMPLYKDVAATAKNIHDHIVGHLDFVRNICRMPVLHVGIYKLPEIYRTTIPVSDTDSSVFSLQRWIIEFCEKDLFCDKAWSIGYFLSYMVCQQLDHLTMMFNASMGIPLKYLDNFKLKNEYYFPVTGSTGRAKVYWYNYSSQEGNLYPEIEIVKKGAAIRGNMISQEVVDRHDDYTKMLADKIMSGGGIESLSIEDVFLPVLELHYSIIEDVVKGGNKYLRSTQVKNETAYKKGSQDPNIVNQKMWDLVYADKFGDTPEAPYSSLVVNVNLGTKNRIDEWLDKFSEVDLADRMRGWIKDHGIESIGTFRLPAQNLADHRVPEDIVKVMDTKKITAKILAPFYITLESLGIYFMNDSITTTIEDYIELESPVINNVIDLLPPEI